MGKRVVMLICGALGVAWALAVVILPGQGAQPFIPLNVSLIYAFAPAGGVLALMILTVALRRFFSDALIDGQTAPDGSHAAIDSRVVQNTVEQMVLALALWPLVALQLGSLTVIVMGVSLALSRLVFWAGYHIAPPLRELGWAAGFYPTVFAVILCLVQFI